MKTTNINEILKEKDYTFICGGDIEETVGYRTNKYKLRSKSVLEEILIQKITIEDDESNEYTIYQLLSSYNDEYEELGEIFATIDEALSFAKGIVDYINVNLV